MGKGPALRYYDSLEGAWSGTLLFRVTDWSRALRGPLSEGLAFVQESPFSRATFLLVRRPD
jgi:hypothetical protein